MLCGASSIAIALVKPSMACLRRAIDGAARGADMAHLRGDVDDRAGQLRLDQPQRHRLRHEERGADVELDDGVEILDLTSSR